GGAGGASAASLRAQAAAKMAKSRTNENLTTSFTRILPEVVGTSCASRCAPDIDQADQYLGLNSTSGVYPFGDSAHTVWARDEPSHDRGACELSTLKVWLSFSHRSGIELSGEAPRDELDQRLHHGSEGPVAKVDEV